MRFKTGRRARPASRLRASGMMPILKIAGLVVAGAGLVVLIIFVLVPLIFGNGNAQDAVVEVTSSPTPSSTPIAKDDMSEDVQELLINAPSVNDPYINASEVVFSTGSAEDIDAIAVYNIETETTTTVETIVKNNDNLFEPKINDSFIIYLDCKNEYGGAVCGYDRNADEAFVMRDYKYGKPKVTLRGDYALWIQQTSISTDRLYLYHLPTKECVEIETFVNTPFSVNAAHMSEQALVFVQPYGESQVLDRSSASMDAEICVIPLEDGGDLNRILFLPEMYAFDPMIVGNEYIVFLDDTGDETSSLMLCTKSGDTYTSPQAIAQGILNYDVGDGYVVYTKDEGIYIYYFADGSSGMLSSDTTRAILASANGKDVVWYDVTGGFDDMVNSIMKISVP